MSTKVDAARIDELAAEFKQLSKTVESGEISVNREISSLISETNSQYDEYYVRSTTSELDRMLREIRTLAISVTERLNSKCSVLKQAAERCRNDEAAEKRMMEKQVGFSFENTTGILGTFFTVVGRIGNVVSAAAGSLIGFISGKDIKNSEATLILPLDIAPLKANLTMNPKVYSEEVKRLQQRLKELGYDIEVDGYFGKQTLKAVNDYKNKYGLGNTGEYEGVVGNQTWLWLFGSLTGELKLDPNTYSQQVKMAQIRLKDLGYDVNATGYFDEKTLKAVNEFKTSNNLGNTGAWAGVIGSQTWGTLFSAASIAAVSNKDSKVNDVPDLKTGNGIVNIKILTDNVNKYVNFKFVDANGKVSSDLQIYYEWGGKMSLEQLNKKMIELGLKADDPKLQEKIIALAKNENIMLGIDCSGFVMRVIDAATNGAAVAYYKKALNFKENIDILSWGVSASALTSLEHSKKITSLADVRPGDYIRFDNGGHIGIVYKVEGNTIYYAHSSGSKGPHIATITVTDAGKNGLNLSSKTNAVFDDWDKGYSNYIQGVFNYICRPNFAETKTPDISIPKPNSSGTTNNNTSNNNTYTVKSGDTLGSIAKKLGTTVAELARINNIANVNVISVGQVLKFPNGNIVEEKPAKDIQTQGKVESKLYDHEIKLIAQINQIDPAFNKELSRFKQIYENNKETYEKISKKTGLPPELIAALHYRESSCNFNTYLHNGDPLGKPTTHVPVGKNFDNFVDAAVDALLEKKARRDEFNLSSDSDDMTAMLAFAEVYNGLGYYNNGRISSYVYSGTNVYKSGKYVSDGKYDPNYKDKQPGVYILIMKLIS